MAEPKGCCSCKLTTSAIVIASLYMVSSLLLLITCAAYLSVVDDEQLQQGLGEKEKENFAEVSPYLKGMFIAGCVIFSAEIIISGLVIFGIKTNHPKLLLPFIIWGLIGVVIYGIMGLVNFFSSVTEMEKHGGGGKVFGNLISVIIGICISLYCIHIVRKTFNYLKTVTC